MLKDITTGQIRIGSLPVMVFGIIVQCCVYCYSPVYSCNFDLHTYNVKILIMDITAGQGRGYGRLKLSKMNKETHKLPKICFPLKISNYIYFDSFLMDLMAYI